MLEPHNHMLGGYMFQVGESVYYYRDGETFPGVILEIKRRVKIGYNHLSGDLVRWVEKGSIEKQ